MLQVEDPSTLTGDGAESKYVLVSELVKHVLPDRQNPKLHDIGGLTESFQRYGFQGGIKFDRTINGIKRGNGRILALSMMQEAGMPPPRGVKLTANGEWAVLVEFGVDAADEREAIAFAIDDNASVMWGGNFTPLDRAKLFDLDIYPQLLEELAQHQELPVSTDGDDLDKLLKDLENFKNEPLSFEDETEENEPERMDGDRYVLPIVLSFAEFQEWKVIRESLGEKKDKPAFLKLMRGDR